MAAAMTKGEREDLQRLVRQREKFLKSAAKQRSSDLIADFENQLGSEYAFDRNETRAAAQKVAEREVGKAGALVAARCRELGIPDRFAPSLNLVWLLPIRFLTPPAWKRAVGIAPAALFARAARKGFSCWDNKALFEARNQENENERRQH